MDDHRTVDVKGRRDRAQRLHVPPQRRATTPGSPTSRTPAHRAVEAAREYARDEGYHFMGPVQVDAARSTTTSKPGRFGIVVAAPPGARRRRRRHARAAVGRADRARRPAGHRSGACPTARSPLPDPNVSRHHAEIRRRATGFVVVDLGSTNGTKVNGARIDGEQRLQRRRHRQLRIARTSGSRRPRPPSRHAP